MRKRNHIAKDLMSNKYRTRVIPNKKKEPLQLDLEEWLEEDAQTKQTTGSDQDIQSESSD
jgi:hypothetical protein